MVDLPASRVTQARPFMTSGVDYCGPLWVHYKVRGKRPHKVYIAVFVCFSTKATHLEVVSDLTTEAFIGAVKRFIARRGRCQTIYSDNATNFIGAKNQLNELNDVIFSEPSQDKIIRSCSNAGIEFKFIPPRAPHFGGLWEAAVKSAKQLLLRSVATASLTYEELETVIIEIEAILNSRPLTPLSCDPNDLAALTPGHFLIGEPLTAQVDSQTNNEINSLSKRWNLVSQLKHEFWRRWSLEYLHQLQEKHKWKTSSENAKEGQLIILKEDNVPIMQWPLGRILKTYEGNDGKVRVADIKTASGVRRRPIERLAPLFHETELSKHDPPKPRRPMPIDEADLPPNKTSKPVISSLLLTIIAVLLLLPAVTCSQVQINKFNSNPGLYFEGIGTVKLATSEWRLMVYYDLNPFSAELEAFKSGLLTLQKLCTSIKHQSPCNLLVNNFIQIKKDLFEEEELFAARRLKRGALNVVGNLARSLFGVLDSDYANEMSDTINRAKEETTYMFQLFKNQTSIIDSTINIIKRDELNTQKHLSQIVETINAEANAINKESEQLSQTQLIALLSNQLTLTAINLQRIEKEIIDVLTDCHHGKISPLLLSPYQLRNELTIIKSHLPIQRTLPIEDDNLIQLYKTIRANGAVTRNEVLFEIMVPLVDQQFLELLNVIPVPTIRTNALVSVSPEASLLAINSHRDEFIRFTTDKLATCIIPETDVYICKNKQLRLRKDAVTRSCDINILSNRTTANCKLIRLTNNSTWTQLRNPNKWIFSTTTILELSAVCGAKTSQHRISGTGIMQLEPSCTVKNDLINLQGHVGGSNTMHTSYVQLKHINDISSPQEITRVLTTTTSQLENHTNQLTELQKQLKESNIGLIRSSIQHHHAVSYSSLVVSIILLLAIIIFKIWSSNRKRIRHESNKLTPQPIPAPRPITVDIIDT